MRTYPYIVAEIGNSHIGDLDRALELADLAKESGADCLKTQKRNPKEAVPFKWQNRPHPNPRFSYGNTYLEHRENIELPIKDHITLHGHCEVNLCINYAVSVWDLTSAKEIVEINPAFIKIPSACNHNRELIDYILSSDQFKGKLHISLGMTTKSEREELKSYLPKNRTVVYHCTSGYPVPFEQLYLNEIKYLCDYYPEVGFSGHHYGIAADIAALALGARYFERHFIDDRCFPHTDAASSLEPQGLKTLVRDIKNVLKALEEKPDKLDNIELEQRDKLRVI